MYPKFPNRRTVHSSEVLIVNEIQDFNARIQALLLKALGFHLQFTGSTNYLKPESIVLKKTGELRCHGLGISSSFFLPKHNRWEKSRASMTFSPKDKLKRETYTVFSNFLNSQCFHQPIQPQMKTTIRKQFKIKSIFLYLEE